MARVEQLIDQLHTRLKEIELPDISTKNYDKGETERAMRQAQIAELDAVNTYQQVAQSTHDPEIKDLLNDVADEEKVHQGEFEAATDKEDPKNKEDIMDGRKEASLKELDEALAHLEQTLNEGFIGNTLYKAGQGVANLVRGGRNAARNFGASVSGVPDKKIDELLAKLGYQGTEGGEVQKKSMNKLIRALYAANQAKTLDPKAAQTFRAILYAPQGYVSTGVGFDYSKWNPTDLQALSALAPQVGMEPPMQGAA